MKTRFALTAALAAVMVTALPTVPTAQKGPAPAFVHIDPEVLALTCAPKLAYEMPSRALRVTGGQDSFEHRAYAPGDLITINGGTDHGIEVGQEYFVRRVQIEGDRTVSRAAPGAIRTNGWIRVYAVDDEMSLATITYACDTVEVGDYLEPFALPTVPTPLAGDARPQKSNYGKILGGGDRRKAFGKGDFFIVDRGSDHGVQVGSRFVVYHDKKLEGNFLFEVGEAFAVDVRPDNSTLQVTLSRDAMIEGDYVALRK
jgi:hypothetical protein